MHGRSRNLESEDDLDFGVHEEMMYAKRSEPVPGKLWGLGLRAQGVGVIWVEMMYIVRKEERTSARYAVGPYHGSMVQGLGCRVYSYLDDACKEEGLGSRQHVGTAVVLKV